MKRVLNSGSIKLIKVLGSEQQVLDTVPNTTLDEALKIIYYGTDRLQNVEFVFEIKAPIALLFQVFQPSNLGTLETFVVPDTSEGYIPPFFYKNVSGNFNQLNEKECNELHTKYSNFYQSVVNFYHKLLERGVCQQEAQLILPQGLFTTFRWTIGCGELITFIDNIHSVSPESYGYCEALMLYLKEQMPKVSEWIQRNKPII